jgi:hypothetical protein
MRPPHAPPRPGPPPPLDARHTRPSHRPRASQCAAAAPFTQPPPPPPICLTSLPRPALAAWLGAALDEPPSRAAQVTRWLLRPGVEGGLVHDLSAAAAGRVPQDGFSPAFLAAAAAAGATADPGIDLVDVRTARDGVSGKLL